MAAGNGPSSQMRSWGREVWRGGVGGVGAARGCGRRAPHARRGARMRAHAGHMRGACGRRRARRALTCSRSALMRFSATPSTMLPSESEGDLPGRGAAAVGAAAAAERRGDAPPRRRLARAPRRDAPPRAAPSPPPAAAAAARRRRAPEARRPGARAPAASPQAERLEVVERGAVRQRRPQRVRRPRRQAVRELLGAAALPFRWRVRHCPWVDAGARDGREAGAEARDHGLECV
jgi:hypothetical protein